MTDTIYPITPETHRALAAQHRADAQRMERSNPQGAKDRLREAEALEATAKRMEESNTPLEEIEPTISDEEANAVLDFIKTKMRKEVVQRLLAGNDAQCFTTEQYLEAYMRYSQEVFRVQRDESFYRDLRNGNWPRKHLESLTVVHEVKPDVWALVN